MKTTLSSIMAFVIALAATPAVAGSSSSDMAVGATVLENCVIVSGPMAFGSVLLGSDVTSTATLTLTCTPNATFDIKMNNGSNADGTQRRMKNVLSAEYLPYEIYLDTSRTLRWGNTVGTDTKSGTASALGLASYTAYGKINGSEAVTDGVYADLVTVTVEF